MEETEEKIINESDISSNKFSLDIIEKLVGAVVSLIQAVAKPWLFGLYIVLHYLYKTTVAFVGVTTNANINIHEFFALNAGLVSESNKLIIFGLAALCIMLFIWALIENHLRRSYVVTLGNMESKWQLEHDANRGSSHLTPQGLTNPEDQ